MTGEIEEGLISYLSHDYLRTNVLNLWDRISDEIKTELGLMPSPCPNQIEVVRKLKPLAMGGEVISGQFILDGSALTGKFPLSAVVAKEALKILISDLRMCDFCVDDFSRAYGVFWCNTTQRRNWYKEWTDTVWCVGDQSCITKYYYPGYSFEKIEYLIGKSGIIDFIRENIRLARNELAPSPEEYILNVLNKEWYTTRPLTSLELKIIRRWLNQPDILVGQIAKEIGVSPQWVSNTFRDLRRYSIISAFHSVSAPRIGLKLLYVLLKATDDIDLEKYMRASPFYYSLKKILTHENAILALHTVPDNPINCDALGSFAKSLGSNVTTSIMNTSRGIRIRNLDYYDCDEGRWKIPWDILDKHLMKIHDEDLAHVVRAPIEDMLFTKANVHLDQIDMILADFYANPQRASLRENLTVEQARKVIKKSSKETNERVRKLLSNGILKNTRAFTNNGLDSGFLITIQHGKATASFLAWTSYFPYVDSFLDRNGNLLAFLYIPSDGIKHILESVHKLPGRISAHLLGEANRGGLEIPIDLWKEELQQWGHSEEAIEKWFEVLP